MVLSSELRQEKQNSRRLLDGMSALVPGSDFRDGEVLVQADSAADAERIARAYGASVRRYSEHGMTVLALPAGSAVRDAVTWGAQEDNDLPVAYPNYLCRADDGQANALPLDPAFSSQYFHQEINAPLAWDLTHGSTATIVAIIDTGIDIDHPEFSGRLSAESYNAYTNQVGIAAVNDDKGHGTHVAGIIAAAMNNGQGGCGVAPEATLLVIKANNPANPSSFASDDLIEAIYYAADHGADIINMSLGRSFSIGALPAEQTAIQYAISKGAIVVCSAGNEQESHAGYPAAYPESLAVSALRQGSLFDGSYSNYGPEIDLSAPGTAIYSTYWFGGYAIMTGTSMACPVVSGVAALVRSRFPELSAEQLKTKLCETATDRGTSGWDAYYGNGEVNAQTAVAAAAMVSVTFDSQGGSTVNPISIQTGSLLPEPPAPARTGYAFAGWYKDRSLTLAWNFASDVVTANMTLYAKWLANQYQVDFNANGGTDVPSLSVSYNSTIPAPKAPTKAGHTFMGWYKESGLVTAWDFASDVVTGHTTLYAKWLVSVFTGLGTETSPFLISSADDLVNLAVLVNDGDQYYNNKIYQLQNNISLSGLAGWTPIGLNSGTAFCGTLDGNGHTISQLQQIVLSVNGAATYAGLLGYNQGTVKNINLNNSLIRVTGDGQAYAGGLVGFNNAGTISHCTFSGSITNLGDTGGIVGYNQTGTVESCINTGSISGDPGYGSNIGGIAGFTSGTLTGNSNAGTVTGMNVGGIAGNNAGTIQICDNEGAVKGQIDSADAGGITGYNSAYSGQILDCFNVAPVSEAGTSGGIIGSNFLGLVKRCYNIGTITGLYISGGICGVTTDAAVLIADCYYLEANQQGIGLDYGHSTGLTTACTMEQMCQPGTFAGFDFNRVWCMPFADFAPVFRSDRQYVHYATQTQYEPALRTVPTNSLLPVPPAPIRSGYIFQGWYKDAAFTVAWSFATDAVTANTTLYAKWITVKYQSHVQNIGWQGWKYNGEVSGTSGQALRLEAMRIAVENLDGGIEYRTHVQNLGWLDWAANGALSGTEGQSLRLEAINIRLTGNAAQLYDIYYRVHAQQFGWMDWAKNGAPSGTAGFAYRLEAIEIVLVAKNGPAPGPTTKPFVDKSTLPAVKYQSHVQNIGWQAWMSNGETSGTSGQSLRLEAMRIAVEQVDGGVEYKTHVQNLGWLDWVANGALSGTEGQSLRLEAINIRLTGNAAQLYDIYYRVHAQQFGWMDWARNGASAGTAGYAYRLEAIEIVLVEKGGPAPGPTANPFAAK